MNAVDPSTVVTMGGVLLLLQAASLCVGIFSRLRRQPPIDRTLQDYVRRDEFDRLQDHVRRTDDKLFDLVREITERSASWQAGVSAQLGRLEAAIESMKGPNR